MNVCIGLFMPTLTNVTDSDVCLEAEVSPLGSLDAAKVLPRPCLGLNVMASPWSCIFGLASTRGIRASKLRYDFIIYDILSVFQTIRQNLNLCIRQRFNPRTTLGRGMGVPCIFEWFFPRRVFGIAPV